MYSLVAVAVVAVVICALMALKISSVTKEKEALIFSNTEQDQTVSDLQQEIQELKGKNNTLDLKVKEQENAIKTAQQNANRYKDGYDNLQTILQACRSKNIGFYSYSFMVDSPFIVVKQNQSKTITLYTGYDGTYEMSLNGNAAIINRDEDNFYDSTTLTVKGTRKGITVATISVGNRSIIFIVYVE